MKSATVAARNQVTWGTKPRSNAENLAQSPKVQKRRQFGGVLKECKRLLDSLGVPVVAAPGEAEAFCAALDRYSLKNIVSVSLFTFLTIFNVFDVD